MSNYAPGLFFVYLITCLLLAFWSDNTKEKMNFLPAFLISFLLPVIGIIYVLLAKDKPAKELTEAEVQEVRQRQYEEQLRNYFYSDNPVMERNASEYIHNCTVTSPEYGKLINQAGDDFTPGVWVDDNINRAKLPTGNGIAWKTFLSAELPERYRVARFIQGCLKKFIGK